MSAEARVDLDAAGRVFVSANAYTDERRWHEAAALLRREDPVHWVDVDHFNPFRVLTKYADVSEVEAQPALFLNEPRAVLGTMMRRSPPTGASSPSPLATDHRLNPAKSLTRSTQDLTNTEGSRCCRYSATLPSRTWSARTCCPVGHGRRTRHPTDRDRDVDLATTAAS